MEIFNLVSEFDKKLHCTVRDLDISNADINEIQTISAKLQATRKAHKALGLAANQAGLDIRMFVMGRDFAEFVCINPEIIESSNVLEIGTEGCLSFPFLILKIGRPTTIKVKYYDQDLKEVSCEFTGSFARCFQHELDHLNGITFTKKVSKLVLAMASKKRAYRQRHK